MGTACSRPQYIYDITSLELNNTTFRVLRSNGEWESGHVLLSGTTLGTAVQEGNDEYPREDLRGKPLATNTILNSTNNRLTDLIWCLLLTNDTVPEKPVKGWRKVTEIHPDGMSEEDAVEWRVNLIDKLIKLEKERYP